jgi:hypothetical protein
MSSDNSSRGKSDKQPMQAVGHYVLKEDPASFVVRLVVVLGGLSSCPPLNQVLAWA